MSPEASIFKFSLKLIADLAGFSKEFKTLP